MDCGGSTLVGILSGKQSWKCKMSQVFEDLENLSVKSLGNWANKDVGEEGSILSESAWQEGKQLGKP